MQPLSLWREARDVGRECGQSLLAERPEKRGCSGRMLRLKLGVGWGGWEGRSPRVGETQDRATLQPELLPGC